MLKATACVSASSADRLKKTVPEWSPQNFFAPVFEVEPSLVPGGSRPFSPLRAQLADFANRFRTVGNACAEWYGHEKRAYNLPSRTPLNLLVAGKGFEPMTFGL